MEYPEYAELRNMTEQDFYEFCESLQKQVGMVFNEDHTEWESHSYGEMAEAIEDYFGDLTNEQHEIVACLYRVENVYWEIQERN